MRIQIRLPIPLAFAALLAACSSPSDSNNHSETNLPCPFDSGAPATLGAAQAHSVFVFGNYTGGQNIAGRIAAGGDVTLSNFNAGYATGGGTAIVAGGSLSLSAGVVGGNAVYGASGTANQVSWNNGGSLSQGTPINFAAAQAQLGKLSSDLAALTVNGNKTVQWGQINLTGSDPAINVFSVSAAELSSATGVGVSAPQGSAAIINVSGNPSFGNAGFWTSGVAQESVIFNFPGATSVAISGWNANATLLAPGADVTFNNGSLGGTLVGKSLTGNVSFNTTGYQGSIGQCATMPPQGQACKVTYQIVSSWPANGGTDFQASVKIAWTGQSTSNWALDWSFLAGEVVNSAWNTTVAQNGAAVHAQNAAWNGALNDGATVELGFLGSAAGAPAIPAAFTVNGIACETDCLKAGQAKDARACCPGLVVQNGVCTAVDLCAGVTCAASDECHSAGTCNPQTGQCSNPAAPDGTLCSTGVCEAGACRAPIFGIGAHQDISLGVNAYDVAIGDFNKDGKNDLAVTLYTTAQVAILLGNGDGTFGTPTTYGTGAVPKFVLVGDWNGDGKPDLAVRGGSGATHYISIFLGNGDGTFGTRADYNVNSSDPSGGVVADWNGDGKLDIATANYVGNSVTVFLGNGDGTFQTAVVYAAPASSTPNAIATADLNGDGKGDLVTANYNGKSVGVMLGNGDGTFGAMTAMGQGEGVQTLAVGDVNGDGKADVAASLYGSKVVRVLLGKGDGTFQTGNSYTLPNGAFDLAIADINHDGKADIAGSIFASNAVALLLGNGDGTFGAASTYAVATGPFYLAIGYLNSDGWLDIATTNYTGKSVSVLLNTSH